MHHDKDAWFTLSMIDNAYLMPTHMSDPKRSFYAGRHVITAVWDEEFERGDDEVLVLLETEFGDMPLPDDNHDDAGIDAAHATPKAKKARVSALPDVRNPPRKYGNKVGRPPKSPPRPASCPSDFAKQAKRKRPAKKDAASAQKRTRRGTAATSAAAVSGSAADPSTALASSAVAASTAAVRAPAASGANAEVHLTSAARALQALLRKAQ
ncbi:hypothetical protein H9P43_007080 [Blastocladiella emersonii ATCC 22665]|nr:hypothetical protein H9P43_007080 [Blastocladiella emersonii ATCC 22665]